ncbi:GNAT family N-acetyltransferase [Streptomyces carpaticus]|uniref:GNAT family N-acetyltransferase n=1 Tax=Streptomyces TaxID=1883 RepID=UPI001FF78FFC|nr:GNAT family N-acetyltransferase [Streptomyces sp. XM4011]MCK1813769.1 GNAT family N-acetyltransferase [Streptomyces sp. XM4011]UWM49194.1 GNAT family N-acetyltransferase [Streptomyces carpaticus]
MTGDESVYELPPAPLRPAGHGVRLREWTVQDSAAMVALFDDPDIARFTPLRSPFDLEAAHDYLAKAFDHRAEGRRVQLAITVDGRTPLGEVVLFPNPDAPREAELGYTVGPAHRGRGLAARAVRVLAEYALRELAVRRVILRIEPENAPSNAVARAAGFVVAPDPPLHREIRGRPVTLLTWERYPQDAAPPG